MGNRRLYGSKAFVIEKVEPYDSKTLAFLRGTFAGVSIKTKLKNVYRIRVVPDPRWARVKKISFREDRIYESTPRRHAEDRLHVYPYFKGSRFDAQRDRFVFEDFETKKAMM